MNNLKLITDHKDYLLLVDEYSQRPKRPFIRTMASGNIEINTMEGSELYGGCTIIAHLPLNNAPVLEGVPLLPELPKRSESSSHLSVYTGIDDMDGKPIHRGSKVEVIDSPSIHKNNVGTVVWGKGNYYVEGTWCAYNVYAWRNSIRVLSNPELPKQEEEKIKLAKLQADYSVEHSSLEAGVHFGNGYKANTKRWSDESILRAIKLGAELGRTGRLYDSQGKFCESAFRWQREEKQGEIYQFLQSLSPVKLPTGFEPELIGLYEQANNTGKNKVEYLYIKGVPYRITNNILQGRWMYETI
jgi:hypothetical protein